MTATLRHPAPPSSTEAPRPAWVLLKHEAAARGFRNALSFRRWCKRNGVPVTKTGRLETVCPADVDAAVLGAGPAAARAPEPPSNDNVDRAFALLTGVR